DLERIRSAIMNARKSGIESQVDSVASKGHLGRNHAYVYDAFNVNGSPEDPLTPRSSDQRADSKPQPILLRRLSLDDAVLPQSEQVVEMVIDAGGKVRSAKTTNGKDIGLLSDYAGWKFIPAFKDNRPVASRMGLSLSYFR